MHESAFGRACRIKQYRAAVEHLGTVFGLVGRAPVIPESRTASQAAVELGPDGTVRYNVTDTCAGTPITGRMAYAPNQQMSERFFFRGAEFRTTALCPPDPRVTGVLCEDQKAAAKGADPGPRMHAPVPVSRVAIVRRSISCFGAT